MNYDYLCIKKLFINFFIWQAIVRGRSVSTERPFFLAVRLPLRYRGTDFFIPISRHSKQPGIWSTGCFDLPAYKSPRATQRVSFSNPNVLCVSALRSQTEQHKKEAVLTASLKGTVFIGRGCRGNFPEKVLIWYSSAGSAAATGLQTLPAG
ncbi:hypothetical protein SAMN04487894_12262 [Niabella drilacis]|uniref:Uncharacterized protein n=1 Tax=Niabella drilacis (strain DSM 25811 / CCM 8410 / CCUG 62505 / LMG 26954 / E90) TaxID=1285928 RepID=A0A1G7AE55_NIADE|nr:hypothetical protein SAMN04487894_12262 [Niabella drilacis]